MIKLRGGGSLVGSSVGLIKSMSAVSCVSVVN